MHLPIKVLVGAILCLIALVVMVVIVTGMSGESQSMVGGLIDWFNKLIGR